MVLLVGYKCPIHGETFAASKHGPCRHCEHEGHVKRLDEAKRRLSEYPDNSVLRAEIIELRRIAIGTDPKSEADHFERLLSRLAADTKPAGVQWSTPRKPRATKSPPSKKR